MILLFAGLGAAITKRKILSEKAKKWGKYLSNFTFGGDGVIKLFCFVDDGGEK